MAAVDSANAMLENDFATAFFSRRPLGAQAVVTGVSDLRWRARAHVGALVVSRAESLLRDFAGSKPAHSAWLAIAGPQLAKPPPRGLPAKRAVGAAALDVLALAQTNDRRFTRVLEAARTRPGWSESLEGVLAGALTGRRAKQYASAFITGPGSKLGPLCHRGDFAGLAKLLKGWSPPVDSSSWYALCALTARTSAAQLAVAKKAAVYLALAEPLFAPNQRWSERWKGAIAADLLARSYACAALCAATLKNEACARMVVAQLLRDAWHLGDFARGLFRAYEGAGFADLAAQLKGRFR